MNEYTQEQIDVAKKKFALNHAETITEFRNSSYKEGIMSRDEAFKLYQKSPYANLLEEGKKIAEQSIQDVGIDKFMNMTNRLPSSFSPNPPNKGIFNDFERFGNNLPYSSVSTEGLVSSGKTKTPEEQAADLIDAMGNKSGGGWKFGK